MRLSVILLMAVAFFLSAFALLGAHALNIRDAILAVCSLLVVLFSIQERRGWGGPFISAFILFSVFSLISVFWVSNIGAAYIRLIDLALAVLLGVAIATCGPTSREIRSVLDAFLIGAMVVSAACLWTDRATLSTWARLGKTLFESAGSNIIEYSCILIYAQIYAAYRFLSSRKRFSWGVAFGFLFICGLLTAVRKAMAIPLIFIYIFLIIRNRKNSLKIIGVTILVGALAALTLFLVSWYIPSLGYRLTSLLNDVVSGAEAMSSGGNSYEERMWLRSTAWQAFGEHPFFGLGVGQFWVYSVAHGGPALYAHNNFLELLANSGITGFVMYYGGLFLLVQDLWRSLLTGAGRQSHHACIFGIAFIVANLVMEYAQVDYYQPYFLLFLFLMSALTKSLESERQGEHLPVVGKAKCQ